jgi:single-strand DNA-binding protein
VDITPRNEVLLVGRLAGEPVERILPSGDALVTFRLVVDRPPPKKPRPGARTPTMDALECATSTAAVMRTANSWAPGDVVEVQGALRRRFWRGPAGLASRYEIDVVKGRRLNRAA